jgi:hypothetical protein
MARDIKIDNFSVTFYGSELLQVQIIPYLKSKGISTTVPVVKLELVRLFWLAEEKQVVYTIIHLNLYSLNFFYIMYRTRSLSYQLEAAMVS